MWKENPFPSRRSVVTARNGMVATSQPLAAQAGLEVLRKGGNAIDAAIATAACLTVVEPTSNGLGSDAFAIVWFQGELYGINGSGKSPAKLTINELQKKGYREVPKYGWPSVTVPGAVGMWVALSERFGKLSFESLLQDAICYGEEGYALTPTLSYHWQRAIQHFRRVLTDSEFKHWFDTFVPEGFSAKMGEVIQLAHHAQTLKLIATTKGESFYRGELADQIVSFSQQTGGWIEKDDLASYQPEWVKPISVSFAGHEVWELPPNGHGITVLMALRLLEGQNLLETQDAKHIHRQIEAMKMAMSAGKMAITDPDYMKIQAIDLLSDPYLQPWKERLQDDQAVDPMVSPPKGGTVYLCTADREGNMVSFIQSNYMGFGSGLVVPNTGIALQNRGADFSMDQHHINALAPKKRSYHTIIPGFLTKQGQAIGPFGVMGGYMQPQGHLQVLVRSLIEGYHPQATLDAPRWQWIGGKKVQIESHMPMDVIEGLRRKGHEVEIMKDWSAFGRGQIIWRQSNGVFIGGTEPRTDGMIAAW